MIAHSYNPSRQSMCVYVGARTGVREEDARGIAAAGALPCVRRGGQARVRAAAAHSGGLCGV
jgi:putative hemolysin